MRLHRQLLIARDPGAVFGLVSDPARYPEFLVGISRWERISRRARGVGARFRVLMKVGSVEAGGVIRIATWRDPELIEWVSESGMEHQGRWRVVPSRTGTELHLELEYRLVGTASWLVERLAGRIIGRNMSATLLAVRRVLEHEPKPTAKHRSRSAVGK